MRGKKWSYKCETTTMQPRLLRNSFFSCWQPDFHLQLRRNQRKQKNVFLMINIFKTFQRKLIVFIYCLISTISISCWKIKMRKRNKKRGKTAKLQSIYIYAYRTWFYNNLKNKNNKLKRNTSKKN